MADATKIEWTDATWNPITGCSVVSPGCTNCYAMKLAGTRLQHHPSRAGLTRETKAGPVWNGTVRFNEEWLAQPLHWKRPRMVFVCAHGDLFHEDVPEEWIDKVFAVMALSPQHTFQVLTKRAARMRGYVTALIEGDRRLEVDLDRFRRAYGPAFNFPCPLPNVWLGVSAEDQARADERVPELLSTPAAVRFVSAEPLLGPIRFDRIDDDVDTFEDCGGHPDPHWPSDTHDATWLNALTGQMDAEARAPDGTRRDSIDVGLRWTGGKLDWIIVGGESGQAARPMHPQWAREIRDQCTASGTHFFFKQWGEWAPYDYSIRPPLPRSHSKIAGNVAIDLTGNRIAHERWQEPGFMSFHRFTKRYAGRLLDGIEHNAMPEAAR